MKKKRVAPKRSRKIGEWTEPQSMELEMKFNDAFAALVRPRHFNNPAVWFLCGTYRVGTDAAHKTFSLHVLARTLDTAMRALVQSLPDDYRDLIIGRIERECSLDDPGSIIASDCAGMLQSPVTAWTATWSEAKVTGDK